MAGRSLASVTVAAAADLASLARRLRSAERRHPLLPRAERGSAGKTARAPPPTVPIPRTPEKRLPGARAGRGHDPEEEGEKANGGLRPREIREIWETCSALGDSCSLRTRTRPQSPDDSAATHPPVEGQGDSGKGARTAPAGSPCARARAPSRDRWGPALSGSRELPNSLKVPGTFLLWA